MTDTNENISIVPAKETRFDMQNMCMYVVHEEGMYDAMKAIRKLGARWDRTGYIVDIKLKNEVEAICTQYGLTCMEHPILEDIDSFSHDELILLHKEKLELKKRSIYALIQGSSIANLDINDLYADDNKAIILSLKNNERILEALFEHHTLQRKIASLENKKNFNKNVNLLHKKCQEELLSYLLKKSLESLCNEMFSLSAFNPQLFTGFNRTVIEGIIKSWEHDLPITLTQIAINTGNFSSEFYAHLELIEQSSPVQPQQVKERLEYLSNCFAQSELTAISGIISNNEPLHKKTEIIRNRLDAIHGESEVIMPQSHYLVGHIDEILNPKNRPISTGFSSLDRLIGGGFKKGELGVLSGGAGAGKSAFALQIADNVAASGNCIIYISVEIGVSKLTERSFKRLSNKSILTEESIREVLPNYKKYADNIFLIKGYSGMTVSDIRGKVLSVTMKNKKDVVLIIDPFQRLGTGNEKIDSGNETIKVDKVISSIKQMAEDLKIPILVLSDTVKNHQENQTGEGAGRSSYMIDHTADYNMMLRTSRNPLMALYGFKIENKVKVPNLPTAEEDPFIGPIKDVIEKEKYAEARLNNSKWDKFAALVTPKVRDSGKFNPLFIYKPAIHKFEELRLWGEILGDKEK